MHDQLTFQHHIFIRNSAFRRFGIEQFEQKLSGAHSLLVRELLDGSYRREIKIAGDRPVGIAYHTDILVNLQFLFLGVLYGIQRYSVVESKDSGGLFF